MAKKLALSPAEMTEKWQRRTKGSISDIVAGIGRVTESPAAKAVAKAGKMKQNLMKSIDDGTWAKRLGAVTVDEWKAKTAAKVQERLSGGVDGATAKRGKFDTWLSTTLNNVLPTIDAMPDMTIEDSVNRVRALMTHMNKNAYKKSS